ncbi:hypothetical protein, partial [Klebsiella pneumoniae]|uniref:hypothetical protein n=2 Tax=Enterobacterales TaxID=91347 RepID=UPI001BB17A86
AIKPVIMNTASQPSRIATVFTWANKIAALRAIQFAPFIAFEGLHFGHNWLTVMVINDRFALRASVLYLLAA